VFSGERSIISGGIKRSGPEADLYIVQRQRMNGAVVPLVRAWTATALPVYLFCAGLSRPEPCFALTVHGALSSSWSFFWCVSHLDVPYRGSLIRDALRSVADKV